MKIIVHNINGTWVRFPGTAQLDAARVARLVDEGVWSDADLAAHGLAAAAPFVAPEGKVAVGAERFEDGGTRQVFDTEDAPVPPPTRRTVPKWLVVARLTDEQLAQALGAMTPRQQERWRASAFPDIWVDDPEMLAILTYVGADPAVVLREGSDI